MVGGIATAGPDTTAAFTPKPLSCADQTLYLSSALGFFFLGGAAPTGPDQFVDSFPLKRSGGNPWRAIAAWDTFAPDVQCTLTAIGDLSVWLGLKNGDDQGARFDLKAEVLKDAQVIATGIAYCVAGVTRNPLKAKEVTVSFDPFSPMTFDGAFHDVALVISARMGTAPSGICPGHANAVGLRVYYDGATRPAGFDLLLETSGTPP
jgi:hypothetical protein